MPLDPPTSSGWPPDKIVNELSRLAADEARFQRRQTWFNIGLFIVGLGALVLALVK